MSLCQINNHYYKMIMEVLVGTGGNQSIPINDPGVSRVHCKIEVLETGHISIVNLSAAGTYLNGSRVVKRTLAKMDDTIQLGHNFTAKVRDLIEKEDYSLYTCHQVVRSKFKDSDAIKVFLDLSANRAGEKMANYTMPVVKSALSYYYIDEGKYRSAQELIYEAGDEIYAMQDGSLLLQGIYATILAVCARLYLEVGRYVLALETIQDAMSIFNRLDGYDLGYSEEQKNEAFSLMEEIMAAKFSPII